MNNLNAQRVNSVKTSLFGKGAINMLPDELKKKGVKRGLIITDKFLYETKIAEKVGEKLLEAEVEYAIYFNVKPNPTVDIVNECLEAVLALEVDLIVAVGGGSPIDTAKAVSIVAKNGGNIQDYEGVGKSKKPGIPIVAINTTAGTGSEVTAFYVVTDEERHSKMVMFDVNCVVDIAINDIDFMLSMPKSLTSATGMDALTHGIEAALSTRATCYTDKDAYWAIETIAEFLPKVVENGNDLEARTMMAYAQNVAGQAFSNAGLGMVHAMAHSLGGKLNLPHGICNSLLLPYVLEYYYTQDEYKYRLKKITKHLCGGKCPLKFIKELMISMDMPTAIKDIVDLQSDDFEDLTDLALIDTCLDDNLVKPSRKDVLDVYRKAYLGTL
ncbi:MAG: iron-containing alcohol dehydrogenase [Lachnospirales bacterium]